MLKTYFRIALRNFRRQPGYTLLNILGLTLGITASLFILLYITEESRFDTYHEKADRIYRVSSDLTEPDDAWLFGLAFIIVLLITLLTTGYHAWRAAKGNPITSLRYE